MLTKFGAGFTPIFTVVSTDRYRQDLDNAVINNTLPPHFLLSLSYRPHENTVLRLLSAEISSNDQPLDNEFLSDNSEQSDTNSVGAGEGVDNAFSSLLLSSGVLYLQPINSNYFTLWNNITTNEIHSLVFIVSNGVLSTCLDGYFIGENPRISLWNTSISIDDSPVKISFSRHLHSIQELVSY